MTLLLVLLAFVLGLLAGRALTGFRLAEASEEARELERDIIRAAMHLGGRITALDVRTRLARSVEEIEERLRQLHVRGYCESEMAPSGRVTYVFPAFDEAPVRALQLEKQILRLAKRHGGHLTAGTVTVETDLSYHEARQVLDEMAEDGICERSGEADSYRFLSFRNLE